MQIVISGLGIMGASMALAIKQNVAGAVVAGYDFAQIQDKALKKGIIDHKIDSWPQDCRAADLVILATPLRIIKEHLGQLNSVVSAETVVTDVGSTKQDLARFVESIGFSGTYIGGHPMTGAEKSGLQAANPLLYENAVYVLTGVTDACRGIAEKKFFPVLEAIKARILLLDPVSHDRILAAISHLPQLLAVALVNLVGSRVSDDLPYFQLAAGGFRDLTRIASSSIDIWQDIIDSNKDNVRRVLQEMVSLLKNEINNLDDLRGLFESANTYHSQVPKVSKGFLSPLTDLMVYVPDEVGVIAKISNTLSRHKIDIRDIELLKIREKEGGVFRLSFTNINEARQAAEALNAINYRAIVRE